MCACWMLPSRYFGSTKWSHEYRSPLCSSASALPQVSAKMHIEAGAPTQDASAASNICTYTLPTSRLTHSSKIADQEPAPLLGADRAVRDQIAFEQVQRPRIAAALAPADVGERQHLRRSRAR